MTQKRYNIYSKYLKNKYGEKVYKLPINIAATCPNRDGKISKGGCIFCGERGAGFESLDNHLSVKQQINTNKGYMGKKFNAKKFIAYFQNFTNTYMPLKQFKQYILEACQPDIVEIAISTRPDCINLQILEYLDEIRKEKNIEISIELGLQTVNYKSLKKINRGHTLAEFIDAVLAIKQYKFSICTHIILNLPWDTMEDTIENAKIISALKIEQIKLHALYIVADTKMGEMYQKGEIDIIPLEEYIERVITFLEYLNPDIVIQRLIGRAHGTETLFVNWSTSWWKIQDKIDSEMEERNSYQGIKYNYLGGKALR